MTLQTLSTVKVTASRVVKTARKAAVHAKAAVTRKAAAPKQAVATAAKTSPRASRMVAKAVRAARSREPVR